MKALLRLLPLLLLPAVACAQSARSKFEFQPNDRVVLLGSTIIEREQKFGQLETALTLAAGEKTITVRNLGWSGDTVFGHARSYFGPPQEGLDRLTKHLEMLKPTVLMACYGSDLAFEGLNKLPDFISGYRGLLDLVRAQSPNVHIVIIAPPPFETLPPPLPDMAKANARQQDLRDALKEFAAKQNATFVDSFELMGGTSKPVSAKPLTDNGLHYGNEGYQLWASKVVEGMGLKNAGVNTAEADTLRKTIIEKDRLFFNRWRPANETYLFGFRKHEQGRNAAEMDEFDPLVAQQDKKIDTIKKELLAKKKLP
jgi:lysophospholipase L1-like esterase